MDENFWTLRHESNVRDVPMVERFPDIFNASLGTVDREDMEKVGEAKVFLRHSNSCRVEYDSEASNFQGQRDAEEPE